MSGDILNISVQIQNQMCNAVLHDASRLHLINGAKYFHIAIRRRHSFYRSVISLDHQKFLFTCTSFSEAESIAAEVSATVEEITFTVSKK